MRTRGKTHAWFAAAVAGVLASAAGSTWWFASALAQRSKAKPLPQGTIISGWDSLAGTGRVLTMRSVDALLVSIFVDYQCPACRSLDAALDSLETKGVPLPPIEIRHLPLSSLHPAAWEAALGAECGARLGDFRSVHRALMARGATLAADDVPHIVRHAIGVKSRWHR